MPNGPIQLNKAKCLVCGDILISTSASIDEKCSCGELTISGGDMMLYRKGKKYKEMSKLNKKIVGFEVNEESPTVTERD